MHGLKISFKKWWLWKEPFCFVETSFSSSSFATNSAGELDVFGHDGHPLGVDCTEIGVFEESHKVCLACFLKRHHSWALESEFGLEVLRNFTNQSLEREFSDEQLGTFLVTANLPQCHSSGSVTVRFLHAAGSWGTLSGSLGRQLLSRGFTPSTLACCLLGTCHYLCLPFSNLCHYVHARAVLIGLGCTLKCHLWQKRGRDWPIWAIPPEPLEWSTSVWRTIYGEHFINGKKRKKGKKKHDPRTDIKLPQLALTQNTWNYL